MYSHFDIKITIFSEKLVCVKCGPSGTSVPTKVSLGLGRTVGVAKRREGLKKQHSVLFFPERDRAAARPSVPTVK